jgi:hypothetical protein
MNPSRRKFLQTTALATASGASLFAMENPAPPPVRPRCLTMWDFSWIERRWPGAGYDRISVFDERSGGLFSLRASRQGQRQDERRSAGEHTEFRFSHGQSLGWAPAAIRVASWKGYESGPHPGCARDNTFSRVPRTTRSRPPAFPNLSV